MAKSSATSVFSSRPGLMTKLAKTGCQPKSIASRRNRTHVALTPEHTRAGKEFLMHDRIEKTDQKIWPPDTTEAENKKPGRSTGPRTPAGKAKSSMNRLKHGLRSEKTILRDEDPAEYDATVQGWLDIYQPQDRKEDELVHEVIQAHWHLKRACKRLEEVEFNLPGNAWNWTPEHQHLFSTFTRYKTTAERSFNRWYREMESHRGRQFREEQILEKARLAAAQVDLKWLNEQEKNTTNKVIYTQVVEVEVEDGECYTSYYPENAEILEHFASQDQPLPLIFKRLIYFLNGVPPEYSWADPKPVEGQAEPRAVQTMLSSRWLELTAKEEAAGTGHIGPLYSSGN